MNDAAHDQSPEEQVSANETDGAIEANPFSAPEAPVAAVMPPLIEGFDPIELASLKTCKTGFNLLFFSAIFAILACVISVLGPYMVTCLRSSVQYSLPFICYSEGIRDSRLI